MFASIFVAFGWIPVVLNQTWVPRLVRRSPDGNVEVDDPPHHDFHTAAQLEHLCVLAQQLGNFWSRLLDPLQVDVDASRSTNPGGRSRNDGDFTI